MSQTGLTIIGAGLAGCEAAWQAARLGLKVRLYEMRPGVMTPAHTTGHPAELVCSNSLGSNNPCKASGLLKAELRLGSSLIMEAADACAVPCGQALGVDRQAFSAYVEAKILSHAAIELLHAEIDCLQPETPTVVAAGPLVSEKLSAALRRLLGSDYLYFYDAVSPIVTRSSLNMSRMFMASRYDKGGDDYVNLPLNREQYLDFRTALVQAESAPRHAFEAGKYYEACLPVEEIARRGEDALRFGPMKPVGLIDPHTGALPYAVVQLRRENLEGTLYNLTGFQTGLKWQEQERIFRMLPGMEHADFTRLGVMHRNSFINAPQHLLPSGQLRRYPGIFIAGQLSGVEGYVESTASGWMAGLNAALVLQGKAPANIPLDCAMGALQHQICHGPVDKFQPYPFNMGLLPALGKRIKNREYRNKALTERALTSFKSLLKDLDLLRT